MRKATEDGVFESLKNRLEFKISGTDHRVLKKFEKQHKECTAVSAIILAHFPRNINFSVPLPKNRK